MNINIHAFMKNVKKTFLLFCIIFTVITILSSCINLAIGRVEDTHTHILDRAVLTLLGSFVVVILTQYDFKNRIVQFMIPYVVFISLAMVYVWISGFWEELHPDAYRDVFLNDTIAYAVVYCILGIYKNINKNKKKKFKRDS